MMTLRNVFGAFLVLTACVQAQQPPEPPPANAPATIADPLTPAEQKLAALLSGTALVGKFSMEMQPDAIPKTERYVIESARKVKGDQWIIDARMKVGEVELPVPVPVHMKWAGDTPMLQITDLSIPLVGEGFTARILFYETRYAGTWQHGKIGGHMWGTLEKSVGDSSGKEKRDPMKPVEKDGTLP